MRYSQKVELRAAVLIPARYASSRFPGKPLVHLLGKPMIEWVGQHMLETGFDVYVITDDARIEQEQSLIQNQIKVLRVDDDVPCGTDRIYLAYQRFLKEKNYDLILNVQGDEPLLGSAQVLELAHFHASKEASAFDICTLVLAKDRKIHGEDFKNPSCVKVIFSDETKECHYFSRASIPFDRDQQLNEIDEIWHHHVGVYSYRPKALEKFVKAAPSKLERIEKLEQLRGLEIGLRFGALITKEQLAGVDTPEDVSRVEDLLRKLKV